jgi:uncharacterized membrane protein
MDPLTPTPEPPASPLTPSHFIWWRNKFLAGFFVAIPLVVTFLILRFIYRQISSVCDPIVIALVQIYRDSLPDFLLIADRNTGSATIPGAAFVITILFIVALGLVTTNVFGSRLIELMERGIIRIPLVNVIYPVLKQVVDSIRDIGSSKESFKNRPVVYVKYPGIQGYFIAFQTGRFTTTDGRAMVSVFLPTAPNPITGFVLLFDARDVIDSGLALDAAWKFIVSAGFVLPPAYPAIKDPAAPFPFPPAPEN